MIAKTFEIRDRATFIAALAIQCDPASEAERYLLARSGYGLAPEDQRKYVILCRLDGNLSTCDPYDWPRGTMPAAHDYIQKHFDKLMTGSVIDVEFIQGVTSMPKLSEAIESV